MQVDEMLIIPACRSMCVEVRDKCAPVLQRFNFQWPQVLDCDRLPEKTDDGSALCMEAPHTDSSEPLVSTLLRP